MKNVQTIRSKAREIRLESKSIHEVIGKIKELFLEYGIKIAFNNYPSTFSLSISNSHKSPIGYKTNFSRKDDLPMSYPGWGGRWSGVVEVVDKKKAKTVLQNNVTAFNDITDIINFMCTGTGSSGDNFSIDGQLWLYDFPLIHDEFNASKNVQITVISENYNRALVNFENKHAQAQLKEIQNDAMNIELDKQYNIMTQCVDSLRNARQSNTNFVRNKFNSEYYATLELPPNQFSVNNSTHQRCQLEYSTMKEVHSDCLDALKYSQKLIAEMEQLMVDLPELFI